MLKLEVFSIFMKEQTICMHKRYLFISQMVTAVVYCFKFYQQNGCWSFQISNPLLTQEMSKGFGSVIIGTLYNSVIVII